MRLLRTAEFTEVRNPLIATNARIIGAGSGRSGKL
jgi:hypothetical protein